MIPDPQRLPSLAVFGALSVETRRQVVKSFIFQKVRL